MTPDQQRDTALSLYRLAWRFPEQAPRPKEASGLSDYGLYWYSSFSATAGGFSVEACVFDFDFDYARIDVDCCGERKLTIEGTPDYVEDMLRAIPYSLRPHMESTK